VQHTTFEKVKRRGGHKHSPNSSRWQKHQLWLAVHDEKQLVYENAYHDQLKGETVSRIESVLLDVDQGEILSTRSYARKLGPDALEQ
jgi:hypothetical protein